ncbi:hypothetical protein BWQ96_02190 [Gracilariopsis chorda]|uniref:Programmed cell death protein 2-like n=1 Tax=Gracilariopsis chorda TaxID=448386 RepID=A0A2V3J0W9_9FLOR|nr:hypothetical protein BWQ96_02190 [Gracilariopsis chorda]|eukprot:PXF47999.1 hypothetical protein BWQ96_02190 [Gracilariopsis chorda]
MIRTYCPRLDLQKFFPALEKKKAVLLHPRRAHVGDVRASKMAGSIAWPQEERWPQCPEHNTDMITVLQLRREDIGSVVRFPDGNDLLQLLWCPRLEHEDNGYSPIARTFWRDSATLGALRSEMGGVNVELDEGCVPAECALHVEEVEEFPSSMALDVRTSAAVDEVIKTHGQEDIAAVDADEVNYYDSLFGAAPQSKAGGHAAWMQDEDTVECEQCGERMEHLLTVASEENNESFGRWAAIEEGVGEDGEDGLDDDDEGEGHTGVMLGDVGSYYVMVCRRCAQWPIATRLQSC